MACEYCRQIGSHDCRCPNYEYENKYYTKYCRICGEKILYGEEYIKNDDDEYAHYECVGCAWDMEKFLGYKIMTWE